MNILDKVQIAKYTLSLEFIGSCQLLEFLQKALPDDLTLSVACFASSREAASKYS